MKLFLCSALVKRAPDTYGHRATLVWADNEDSALGKSVRLWVNGGFALEDFDVAPVNVQLNPPVEDSTT